MSQRSSSGENHRSTPTEPPTTICHIVLRLDFGGLENGLVNLINHLPANQFRHHIICLQYATDFKKRIRRNDVVIYEMHKKDGKDLPLYFRMWKLLRTIRPDIVHTRNISTLDMLPVAWLAGVKRLVHSEHGLDFMEIHGNHVKYNKLRRFSRLFVREYIAVSNELADWLHKEIGISRKHITAIHNGVDTDRFRHTKRSPELLPQSFGGENIMVLGTIGRIAEIKDQMNLAQAFALVLKKAPILRSTLRLAIIGDGEEKTAIENFLIEEGLDEFCWLPGYRSDTDALYNSFDLFVLPSKREGISNTILEAMASGLPVLATRVGGNPEIVSDGETGMLVEPSTPNALAAAILEYLNDPAKLKSHGAEARRRALADFSMETMVRNYTDVYLRT